MIRKLTEIRVLDGYRVWVRFDDGAQGEVDFSQKPRTGVYTPWQDYNYFRTARIGEFGDLVWDDQVDFSADSLWRAILGQLKVKQARKNHRLDSSGGRRKRINRARFSDTHWPERFIIFLHQTHFSLLAKLSSPDPLR
jgi:Protein of unknown function (DUF2442)